MISFNLATALPISELISSRDYGAWLSRTVLKWHKSDSAARPEYHALVYWRQLEPNVPASRRRRIAPRLEAHSDSASISEFESGCLEFNAPHTPLKKKTLRVCYSNVIFRVIFRKESRYFFRRQRAVRINSATSGKAFPSGPKQPEKELLSIG